MNVIDRMKRRLLARSNMKFTPARKIPSKEDKRIKNHKNKEISDLLDEIGQYLNC